MVSGYPLVEADSGFHPPPSSYAVAIIIVVAAAVVVVRAYTDQQSLSVCVSATCRRSTMAAVS